MSHQLGDDKSCHLVIMATSCGLTLFDSFSCNWSWKMCRFFYPYKARHGNELDAAVFLVTLSDANCAPGYPAGSTPGFQLCPLIIYTCSKAEALKRIHCLMQQHLSKQGSIRGNVVPNEHNTGGQSGRQTDRGTEKGGSRCNSSQITNKQCRVPQCYYRKSSTSASHG